MLTILGSTFFMFFAHTVKNVANCPPENPYHPGHVIYCTCFSLLSRFLIRCDHNNNTTQKSSLTKLMLLLWRPGQAIVHSSSQVHQEIHSPLSLPLKKTKQNYFQSFRLSFLLLLFHCLPHSLLPSPLCLCVCMCV